MSKMRYKKLRLWAVYPFAALYLVFVYRYGMSLRPGIWFIIGGLIIRFWAAGYIHKIRKLTTAGPYAFVRNPLYIGNFLIGLGFCLFVKNTLLILIYIVLFSFFYAGTIRKEEAVLSELFGRDYLEYKKSVPALIPRLARYRSRDHIPYSLQQAHYNGELIRILVTSILLCLLYVAHYFLREKGMNASGLWKAGFLIGVQVILLLLTIAHRRRLPGEQDTQANVT